VFTYDELQTNAVQDWINSVNSQNPSGPCTGLGLELNTSMNSLVAQNSISVLTSVLSVLTDIDSENDNDEDDDGENSTNGTKANEQSSRQIVTQQSNNQVGSANSNNQLDTTNPNNQGNSTNDNNQSTTNSNNQIGSTNSNNQSTNSNNSTQGQIVSSSYNNQTQMVSNNSNTNVNSNNNGQNNNSQNSNNTTGIGASNTVGNSNNINSNQGTSNSKGNQTSTNEIGGNGQDQRSVNTTENNTTTTGKQEVESNLAVNQAPNQASNSNSNPSNPINNNNSNNSTEVSSNQTSNGQNVSVNNQTPETSNQNNITNNQPITNNNGAVTGIVGAVSSVRIDNTEQSDTNDKNKDAANNALLSAALSSSSVKNKVSGAKKGNLIMNGDIVVIGSATGTDPNQFRFNASIISSNTKNTFAKGALINFTSYVNNSNMTLFVSYRYKKFTSIFANSTMVNFDKDLFNTISIMESYKYRKVTSTLGLNLTSGNLGSSKFQSISVLGGVFSDFKLNKKIKMTTMFVMVYSPYVYYYQGMWYDSGYLAIPFVSGDYKITKKFKLNISFSGVQQLNDRPLTYQILTGAKAIL